MKKVLILWDSDRKDSPGPPEYYTLHRTTGIVIAILESLSIPFEAQWVANVSQDDASDYALVIIPELRYNMTQLVAWANGTSAAPVFVGYGSAIQNAANLISGANGARQWQSGHTSLTTPWGLLGLYNGNYIYPMDDTDTAVTKLAYDATGRCAFWKHRGTGNDVYFWGSQWDTLAFALTHVLAQVYTAAEVSFPILAQIDHPEDANIAYLTAFIAWLRARNAVCPVGLKTDVWAGRPAEMVALIRDNQDVLIPMVHSHGANKEFFGDDTNFPSVATKIAEYHIEQAILAADGVNAADNGALGFQLLPSNSMSLLGTEAAANLGITAWRCCSSGHPWAQGQYYANQPVTLYRVGDNIVRVVGIRAINTIDNGWTTLPVGADYHYWRAGLQLPGWTRMFWYNAPLVYVHGTNNMNDENPGQAFFNEIDTCVQAASPIVRWATREDLAHMAKSHGKRRTRWR